MDIQSKQNYPVQGSGIVTMQISGLKKIRKELAGAGFRVSSTFRWMRLLAWQLLSF